MTITSKITWSDNKKQFCIDLKEAGNSIEKIRDEFNIMFDEMPTYKAIQGMLGRYYGLGERRGANMRSMKSVKTASWFKEPAPTNFTIPLVNMARGMCYYTQDEGADMKLCGEPVAKGKNYCEACCCIAYNDYGKKRDVNVKPMGGYERKTV